MGGVGALCRYRVTGANLFGGFGALGVNQFAAFSAIFFADQCLGRDHGLIRVTHVATPIGIGELHALNYPMQVGGTVVAVGLQWVGL